MLIFSHRGYHTTVPENTLDAFQLAIDLGVDGIETDIRLSADQQAVLFHDRLTPDGREVAKLTQRELSDAVGYHVPTLDEVLARWNGVTWMPEIKAPQAAEVAMRIVAEYAPSRRMIITSFWHTIVNQMGQVPGVQCGVLVAHRPLDLSMTQLGWHPGYDPIRYVVWKYDCADPELMLQAQAAGLINYVYDVESHDDHVQCVSLGGVGGIITDRPDWLVPLRETVTGAQAPTTPNLDLLDKSAASPAA